MRTVFANIISAVASVGITAIAVAASAPAVAADVDGAPTATIQTSDLNLQSPAGRTTAMRRIEAAATRVCDANRSDPLDGIGCRGNAIAGARQSLDRLSVADQIAAR